MNEGKKPAGAPDPWRGQPIEITAYHEQIIVTCDYRCDLSKGDKESWEGGVGFEMHPAQPTKWCFRQCDRLKEEKAGGA